tara:strand:- start:92 stop:823 length:732 start_codon:yes stop_codon:yes gene_type:complete
MNANHILLLILILILFIICQYKNTKDNFREDFEDLSQSLQDIETDINQLSYPQPTNDGEIASVISENIRRKAIQDNSNFNVLYDLQENERGNLDNQISDLEKIVNKTPRHIPTIKSVKSLQNGTNLSVIPLQNKYHLIKLNEGCLSCDSINKYRIKKCNPKDNKQYFRIHKINNKEMYNLNLHPGTSKITDKQNKDIRYPFYLIGSTKSNNYLQNNNNLLSIQPCDNKLSQRWEVREEDNICK